MILNQAASSLTDGKELWGAVQDDFFSDIELVYNVGWLVSGVQQSDSVIHIYTLFLYYFPLWFIIEYLI